MFDLLLVGPAGEERIKPVPGCLLEQQKFVFCYFSSCCLVIRLREAVSSVQETGSEEGCLNLSVPSEKSQSLISFRKELRPLSPSTCYLQYSQFCTAYNHHPGAIVFHPDLPGAFRSWKSKGIADRVLHLQQGAKMRLRRLSGSQGISAHLLRYRDVAGHCLTLQVGRNGIHSSLSLGGNGEGESWKRETGICALNECTCPAEGWSHQRHCCHLAPLRALSENQPATLHFTGFGDGFGEIIV